MKLHQQFDLNLSMAKPLGRELMTLPPYIIEELITKMSKKGYTVLKSSAYYMGIPQSIIVIKEFTGPFVSHFTSKIRKDFDEASRRLGINELFM
ncbi:hypothetical protein HY637_03355 [Candidatus Woesearchaeota archaeon]|nr:hypothetical protein [Candidatus Woesearchaeota archaeon]